MVDLGVLYALGSSNLDSITELRAVSDGVQNAYTGGLLFDSPQFVNNEDAPQLDDLVLNDASPNPVAGRATLTYSLASPSPVELTVVDVLGRQVLELVNTRQLEGTHEAEVDARALAPGVYIARLKAGEATTTTRFTVVR